MRAPESILVIKPSSFGDVVHTLPAVARLKQVWPGASLDWVINPEWAPLLDENPDVSRVIHFPRREFRGLRGILGFNRWCQTNLASGGYDLAIDFQGLLRSAWMGHASGATDFVGMSDAREGASWFYRRTARMPKGPTHAVERYLATADFAWADLVEYRPLRFSLPDGDLIDGVEAQGPFVLLHPFARGAGKSLTEPMVQQICQRLAPLRTVLAGRTERPLALSMSSNCTDLLNRTSLKQLIWLIRKAAAIITVDSGPSHLAAALKRPLIAIHTWSDPRKVGPYRDDAWVWKNAKLATMGFFRAESEAFFRQPPPALRERDITGVAELAIALSDSCA